MGHDALGTASLPVAGSGRRQDASETRLACELGAIWEDVAIPRRECGCDVPCPEGPVANIASDVWGSVCDCLRGRRLLPESPSLLCSVPSTGARSTRRRATLLSTLGTVRLTARMELVPVRALQLENKAPLRHRTPVLSCSARHDEKCAVVWSVSRSGRDIDRRHTPSRTRRSA